MGVIYKVKCWVCEGKVIIVVGVLVGIDMVFFLVVEIVGDIGVKVF